MKLGHNVETDDGAIGLTLGDGDTIFELTAFAPNGKDVTVYLDPTLGQQLLYDAGAVRVAFGIGSATERVLSTLDGVPYPNSPEGSITFMVPARAATSTMTVDNGMHGRRTVTLPVGALDDLTVGLNKILSQI